MSHIWVTEFIDIQVHIHWISLVIIGLYSDFIQFPLFVTCIRPTPRPWPRFGLLASAALRVSRDVSLHLSPRLSPSLSSTDVSPLRRCLSEDVYVADMSPTREPSVSFFALNPASGRSRNQVATWIFSEDGLKNAQTMGDIKKAASCRLGRARLWNLTAFQKNICCHVINVTDVTVLLLVWSASGFPHLHPVPQRPTAPPRPPPTSQMCLADLGSKRSRRRWKLWAAGR